MAEFTMPSLGADMTEGLLQEWLVGPGDRVHKGDVIAVVETDKAAIEVECFDSGVVGRLLVRPGTRVPVGTPLAEIDDGGAPGTRSGAAAKAEPDRAAPPEPPAPRRKVLRESRPERKSVRAETGSKPGVQPTRITDSSARPASRPDAEATSAIGAGPLVRHLALERGIDMTAVRGTGHGGRITRSDVERAVSAPAPAPAPRVRATPYARRLARDLGTDLTTVQGTGDGGAVRAADVRAADVHTAERAGTGRREPEQPAMRRAIADLMSRSKREIPHYYLSTTIDFKAAADWLRRSNRGRPPTDRLVPAALLLKAAAAAARAVPSLNGYWQNDEFVPGNAVNLGIAVSLRQGGLLAPVIHGADTMSPDALMSNLKDLVERARRGRLRGTEMSGATLTVTNLGDQGVETVFGVIHPPQVALVGFGAVVERPWAADGMLGVRPVVTATLAADHRATDGAVGARYLTTVDRLLQRPEEL